MMRVLLIDNYDSFTYNLYQYFGLLGPSVFAVRNDCAELKRIESLQFDSIVISPGPKRPEDAGLSKRVIEIFASRKPILGVCLGQQCINEVFGGTTVRALEVRHGKVSLVYHNGDELFKGVRSPFPAARYHSLVCADIPGCLRVTARTRDGVAMALRHKDLPVFGVQFHPESFMTPDGLQILKNFLSPVFPAEERRGAESAQ
jgi:anthranilate synthase/aminodeoxychorismate synthase-like glutamine amidotransferase